MLKLVQQQLEFYNKKDLKAFCNCYHDNVQVKDLVSERLICQGKQQFREIYKNLFDTNPDLYCEVKSRMVLDSAVIDEEMVTGVSKYPNGLHTAAIYGFKDGLISNVWFSK